MLIVLNSYRDYLSYYDGKPDDDALRASLPPGLSEGNLAALEEEDPPPSSPPNMRAAMAPPTPSSPLATMTPAARSSPRQLPASPTSTPTFADKKGNPSTKIGVLVALVVMAVGAAAWFTHLIPHN